MGLYDAVNQIGGTDSQHILNVLLEVIEVGRDTTLHNNVWVAKLPGVGVELAEELYGAIVAAGMPGFAVTYASYGVDISDQLTRDKLDAIAIGFPSLAGLCIQLKAIGIQTMPRWQYIGLSEAPTLSDVDAAMIVGNEQRRKVTFANEVWNPAISDVSKSVADMQAIVADSGNWS